MMAARLGFEKTMVGTRWATPKRPWLVPGGPPHALTAWTGLENTTLTLQRAGFWPERLLGL